MEREDRILIQSCLDIFLQLRGWVDQDYYRSNISPLVTKMRERLAYIDSIQFKRSRLPDDFQDTVPQKFSESISQFGIFKDEI